MSQIDELCAELLQKVRELELLTQQLLKEQEEESRLGYAWSGDLGHWYWNIQTNSVVFNTKKIQAMGYDRSELPERVTYQFFTDRLHPDDYERTMAAMKSHMRSEAKVYEVEYRIKAKNGEWIWFYDRGKITQWDSDGKPLFAAGIVFDISEQKARETILTEHNRLLSEDARTDSLTGILNRKAILADLNGQMMESSTQKKPVSVVLVDIDHFKSINDTYGHVTGDMVLKEVTQAIRDVLRDRDSIGRYGGEEFLVILPETDLNQAIRAGERIRREIASREFSCSCPVTISGGVQTYQGEDLMDLIHSADQKLYQAKQGGRNRMIG